MLSSNCRLRKTMRQVTCSTGSKCSEEQAARRRPWPFWPKRGGRLWEAGLIMPMTAA